MPQEKSEVSRKNPGRMWNLLCTCRV